MRLNINQKCRPELCHFHFSRTGSKTWTEPGPRSSFIFQIPPEGSFFCLIRGFSSVYLKPTPRVWPHGRRFKVQVPLIPLVHSFISRIQSFNSASTNVVLHNTPHLEDQGRAHWLFGCRRCKFRINLKGKDTRDSLNYNSHTMNIFALKCIRFLWIFVQ